MLLTGAGGPSLGRFARAAEGPTGRSEARARQPLGGTYRLSFRHVTGDGCMRTSVASKLHGSLRLVIDRRGAIRFVLEVDQREVARPRWGRGRTEVLRGRKRFGWRGRVTTTGLAWQARLQPEGSGCQVLGRGRTDLLGCPREVPSLEIGCRLAAPNALPPGFRVPAGTALPQRVLRCRILGKRRLPSALAILEDEVALATHRGLRAYVVVDHTQIEGELLKPRPVTRAR